MALSDHTLQRHPYVFESSYKKLGYRLFRGEQLDLENGEPFRPFIKIVMVPAGYRLMVDFTLYETTAPTLFFVAPNQFLKLLSGTSDTASMLFYNRDFYCVQIHDAEVACDGLLFNNIFAIPKVDLAPEVNARIGSLFLNIAQELRLRESSAEEMIRTYLKQIIILSTREWKKQNLNNQPQPVDHAEKEFFRQFGRLVEIHYKQKHAVADYADLMGFAPKTLTNKFNRLHLENPNEIIKNRIVLEAKRLLIYTDHSVKEIAFQLGYDDPAYFNRLFTQKAGISPVGFRKEVKE